MIQHYDTDDFFKSQLEDFEMEAPMHLWEGVRTKRSFGHRILNQLRLKWYYGLPLLLLLGVGAAWMSSSDISSNANTLSSIQQEHAAIAIAPSTSKTIQKASAMTGLNASTESMENKANTDDQLIGTAIVRKKQSITQPTNTIDFIKESSEVALNKTKTADYTNLLTNKKKSYSLNNNQKDAKASVSFVNDKKDSNSQAVLSNLQSNKNMYTTNNNDVAYSNQTATNINFAANGLLSTSSNDVLGVDYFGKGSNNGANQSPFETSSLEAPASLMSKNMGLDEGIPNLNGLSPDQGCVDFGGNRRGKVVWYVEGFVSPDYSIKRLTFRNSEAADYIDQRTNTETYLFGGSGGIRVGVSGKYLGFKTGVTYNQINERFELNRQVLIDSMMVTTTDTILTDIVDTTFITRTFLQRNFEKTTKTTYNYYRSIEIPFLVTYNINRGRRFDLGVTAGALLNVWTQRKGEILNPANTVVDISDNTIFRKTYGLNLYAGMDLAFHMTNQVDFMVEPQVRYNMQPLTKGDHIVIQKYFTAGVNVGFRYRF